MIDAAIKGALINYDDLVEQCEKRVEVMAKKKRESDPECLQKDLSIREGQYREAQSAYALTVIMG